jgi:pentapeptide repeat protein
VIKEGAGALKVETVLDEIAKLEQLRALGLPEDLFGNMPAKLVTQYRQRAGTEWPRELRHHPLAVRYTVLAALCWQREREITDDLVELLIHIAHHVGVRAEEKVNAEVMKYVKKVMGKAKLDGASLIKADLSGANLTGAKLSGANLIPILESGEEPFDMFRDLWIKHREWVFDPIRYPSVDRLIEVLETEIVRPAQERFANLLARKAEKLRIKASRTFRKFLNALKKELFLSILHPISYLWPTKNSSISSTMA